MFCIIKLRSLNEKTMKRVPFISIRFSFIFLDKNEVRDRLIFVVTKNIRGIKGKMVICVVFDQTVRYVIPPK